MQFQDCFNLVEYIANDFIQVDKEALTIDQFYQPKRKFVTNEVDE